MASPAVGSLTVISRRLANTPPPDQPHAGYFEVADVGDMEGEGGHRAFLFEVPLEGRVEAERGADMTQIRTRTNIRLRLSGAGKNTRERTVAVYNESALLIRRINTISDNDWPAGHSEVIVRRWFSEPFGDEDHLIRFELDLITEETD